MVKESDSSGSTGRRLEATMGERGVQRRHIRGFRIVAVTFPESIDLKQVSFQLGLPVHVDDGVDYDSLS